MRLTLDVYGDVQFDREILRVMDRGMDMSPAFEGLADDFLDIESAQFDSQGMRSGGWAPLKPTTIEAKRRKGQDPRILHASLRMRNSLTNRFDPDHVREISADSMFVGTRVRSQKGFPYAAAHQNPKQGQTQRRPVEFTSTDRVRWVKNLQEFLVGNDAFRRAV